MIRVEEGNYEGLIKQIALVREYDIELVIGNTIIKELKALKSWQDAKACTEAIMDHGRYNLKENLWPIVLSEVDKILFARKINEERKGESDNPQGGTAIVGILDSKIRQEMNLWLSSPKPLYIDGEPVVKRDTYFPKDIDPTLAPEIRAQLQNKIFTFELWNLAGRPKLESILMDGYIPYFYEAEKKEESTPGSIELFQTKFLARLICLRVEQMDKYMKEANEEKRRLAEEFMERFPSNAAA